MGNSVGSIKFMKKQCEQRIYRGGWLRDSQCSKKATAFRDKKSYCTMHDPEYIKKKERKADEKWKKDNCKKCNSHFYRSHYKYCPHCGTKK